ncbi:hypothetical protein GMLC_15140 [Geomonas limicola]|uniref:Globin-sensor domain-containing protein n=1 Tax=Geomonas limicola TaxID=2740186 RepID=A0A6V8N5T6_9BACT|nr:hypothetical protein GMLC_15140 [Geomonas limicola]
MHLTADDDVLLNRCRGFIEAELEQIITEYLAAQARFEEMADYLKDDAVLRRLRSAERRYVLGLFCGHTGHSYVTNRLRIGLVHRRVGIAPQLYLAAVKTLKDIIYRVFERHIADHERLDRTARALEKLIYFDITLVFDSYLRSLLGEIEQARTSAESYALSLELQVAERTEQLEEKVIQLERALAAVKRLEGVIPICGVCKKIRNDKESWQQLEQYISEHSQALFSHGLCPECYQRQMRALEGLSEDDEESKT